MWVRVRVLQTTPEYHYMSCKDANTEGGEMEEETQTHTYTHTQDVLGCVHIEERKARE